LQALAIVEKEEKKKAMAGEIAKVAEAKAAGMHFRECASGNVAGRLTAARTYYGDGDDTSSEYDTPEPPPKRARTCVSLLLMPPLVQKGVRLVLPYLHCLYIAVVFCTDQAV
jgi:hypothetical protein